MAFILASINEKPVHKVELPVRYSAFICPACNSVFDNLKIYGMNCYKTKAKTIISLQERGYDNDFILKNEYLLCLQQCELINPDEFEITESYRFDGKPNLKDNFVIYAIRALNNDIRGILMTSYSALAEGISIHLWCKLATHLN
jgi:hypothetical protein